VFATGVYDSAADWRASVAATTAPAAELWASPVTMSQAVGLTHELDPDGEALMALGLFTSPGARLSVVDGPRMSSVLTWPGDWTPGTSVDEVQRLVESHGESPSFAAARIGVRAVQDLGSGAEVTVELRLLTSAGDQRDVFLGPFRDGPSTRSAATRFCRAGCRLERMTLGGPAASRIAMSGTFTIQELVADGVAVPGALTGAGWALSKGVGSELAAGQSAEVSVRDGALLVDVDSGDGQAFVRMAPGDLPAARPVVVGVRARDLLGDDPGSPSLPVSGVAMAVDPVLSAESLPLVGPAGLLIDYRMLVTDRVVYDQVFTVYVAAAGDAPASLRAALADRGFRVATTLPGERETLDQGAYALALRLYAVAAVLVLVMAFAGLFVSTAVQLPARRRDAAALRVVGVPRRVVVSAVARELVVVLGGAAVAGITAGALAQYLVLRTIRLGYVEDLVTPRLVPSVDLGQLALIAAAAALALGAFALVSGAVTVRGARGATLRENAR